MVPLQSQAAEHLTTQTILIGVAVHLEARGHLRFVQTELSMSSFGRQSFKISKEEVLWREAHNFVSLVSDYDFLERLRTGTFDECLRDPAVEAEETAYACLTAHVDSLVADFSQQILSIQKGERDKQIQRELSSGEDRELGTLRADFVRQIEDLTRQRSRPYVLYSLEEGR
jgi:hypothetical protein